jgi:hypothetical protein
MTKFKIDRIRFRWAGEWAPSTEYIRDDIVYYDGKAFVCVFGHTSSATNFNDDLQTNSIWVLMFDGTAWKSDWQTATLYNLGNLVRYNGYVYRCADSHTSSSSQEFGFIEDIEKWVVVVASYNWTNDWAEQTEYHVGDIVRKNSTLWIAVENHISNDNFDDDINNWLIWIPGSGYKLLWDSDQQYFVGDIVLYGGWTFIALENNTNSIPSVNGKLQNIGDWQLLIEGYNFVDDWNPEINYKTGDVVRNNGYLYKSVADNVSTYPDSDINIWKLIVPGIFWKSEWFTNLEYFLGDVVTVRGTAYSCVQRHISTSTDRPDLDITNEYWVKLIQGEPSNVLQYKGDIKTRTTSENVRLPVGFSGKVLKVNQIPSWEDFDLIPKVYYVSNQGTDEPNVGTSINAPFKTIKYASEYILEDLQNRTPATIFVKTGVYEEILPIVVPANVAIVGDELRSTTIKPAANFEQSNMFYLRNGSGLRNMTLQGLNGILGLPNEYLTRRPSGGAFVSLDPGTGPNDQSVWITTKSPYVQNVTTFGTGCVGMKIDGSLHTGGNRSIVANDFTQILSDGIGYWADNLGRSELVSVFTYYCHIGYLSTNGGVLRGTNGNNSYGEFGSVAEGVDLNETPILGKIDNRQNQATVVDAVTFGTNEQRILAIGYNHAGQNYSTANIQFSGSGFGALGSFEEFRNQAISQIRVIDAQDSVVAGGLNYQFVANTAQSGGDGFIRLSQADIGTSDLYEGMRIFIAAGQGVGQYGYITSFNAVSKDCIISRESDGANGWDHIQPGWPIEPVLNETTRYIIEPRVTVSEVVFETEAVSVGINRPWKYIAFGDEKFIAIDENLNGNTNAIVSSNGSDWTSSTITSGYNNRAIIWSGQRFIILHNNFNAASTDKFTFSTDGENWNEGNFPTSEFRKAIATDKKGKLVVLRDGTSQTIDRSTDHGETWNTSTISGSNIFWTDIAYGNGKFVAVSDANGEVASSTNNGGNWTVTNTAMEAIRWDKIIYGNGRFVALSIGGDDSTISESKIAYSFNGTDWLASESILGEFNNISYGEGVFLLTGPGTEIYKSQDGKVWKNFDESSTLYTTTEAGQWQQSAYGNGIRVLTNANSNTFNIIKTGATPVIRAKIEGSRVTEFIIYDPGSNYTTAPNVSVFDPRSTANVSFDVRINNGVLPQPEMQNRGLGYFTARASVSGNGFADIYQIGDVINFKDLSFIPRTGSNIKIDGIDTLFSVVRIESEEEIATDNFNVKMRIIPSIRLLESPDHETDVEIRIKYSQIRLTGHDFLDIGTGNFESTKYPGLYLEGVSPENDLKPFQEVVQNGGGRVFYTSTDQDGNFRVGDLFEVRQASGSVTINASVFDLRGLTDLRLGGVRVGGSSNVVVREFSRDGTFAADSNNVIPTQSAILKYINSRITGGTDGAATGRLVAGQIDITGNQISTTSGLQINIPRKVNMLGGIDGKYLAMQYYTTSGRFTE